MNIKRDSAIGIVSSIAAVAVFVSLAMLGISPAEQLPSTVVQETTCFFENDDLLNYLHNQRCTPPDGIIVDNPNRCVYEIQEGSYVDARCENDSKASVEDGCIHINQNYGIVEVRCA